MFYAKYFISQLLLVPALFLATRGIYIYKRDSFGLAKKYYSQNAWRCIEIATEFRKTWDQTNISQGYLCLRENINIKQVQEIDSITKVLAIDQNILTEFNNSYKIYISETSVLLTKNLI